METDVLIIGSGIGGLTLAIKIATHRSDLKVAVITKTVQEECNTKYAQGGISAVWNKETDNFEKHIADTLDAGDGLCDKKIVRIVIEEGPDRVKELIDWGARFDKEDDGSYNLGKEGGHSENRILHYKDQTGAEMHRAIMEKARLISNITLLEHYFALDFLTQHHLGRNVYRITRDVECYGAYVLNKKTNSIEKIVSRITVAATGGAGQIYKSTTNPVIATGDGVAMMYRAKGRLENMEFVQFHPTSYTIQHKKVRHFWFQKQ